jgi:hypothetical protein
VWVEKGKIYSGIANVRKSQEVIKIAAERMCSWTTFVKTACRKRHNNYGWSKPPTIDLKFCGQNVMETTGFLNMQLPNLMDQNEHFGAPCCLCLLPWRRKQQAALTFYELSTRLCGAEKTQFLYRWQCRPEVSNVSRWKTNLNQTFQVFLPLLPVNNNKKYNNNIY